MSPNLQARFRSIFNFRDIDKIPFFGVLFISGCLFSVVFAAGFEANFYLLLALFIFGLIASVFNRKFSYYLLIPLCLAFLFGAFYVKIFDSYIKNEQAITGLVYVDGLGKVESIKHFHNKINHQDGAFLVISDLKLHKSGEIIAKNSKISQKNSKKRKKTSKNSRKTRKKSSKKQKTFKFTKTQQKNLLNVENYQEIDREFLNSLKNYQQVDWAIDEKTGKKIFAHPPQKIGVTLPKISNEIVVNDQILAKFRLNPPSKKEFPHSFDFALNARSKNIGAYGYVIGNIEILAKNQASNFGEWVLSLREKIRRKIKSNIEDEERAALANAFLIGDKKLVSGDLMQKIRNSGLAHLLSISGFHLSLAGAILFFSMRFSLAKSEYLALHFDAKKIAAILAIFSTYFYLQISGSSLPAQRAFLMIFLALLTLCLDEKINAKRAVTFAALILVLINPYFVLTVSFQLSFVAILAVVTFVESNFARKINEFFQDNSLTRFSGYFVQIICLSFFLQIATLPFLIYYFKNIAYLSFVANFLAIPLVSFAVMPLGFMSLLLMPLGLEGPSLFLMERSLDYFVNIADLIDGLTISEFANLQLNLAGFLFGVLGLLLFCLSKSVLRFAGILIFIGSFAGLFFNKMPDISFDNEQKFFAIYDQENGLVFSKKLRKSKHRNLWMKKFGENKFKYLAENKIAGISCNKLFCEIKKNSKKILVLIGRNKISEICKNDFDILINLTRRYQLPECIKNDKMVIDNNDFLEKGGQFFYFSADKVRVINSS